MNYKLLTAVLLLLMLVGASKVLAQALCYAYTYGNNDGAFASCDSVPGTTCENSGDDVCEVDYCYANNNVCGAHQAARYAYCVYIYDFCEYPGCRNVQCGWEDPL